MQLFVFSDNILSQKSFATIYCCREWPNLVSQDRANNRCSYNNPYIILKNRLSCIILSGLFTPKTDLSRIKQLGRTGVFDFWTAITQSKIVVSTTIKRRTITWSVFEHCAKWFCKRWVRCRGMQLFVFLRQDPVVKIF